MPSTCGVACRLCMGFRSPALSCHSCWVGFGDAVVFQSFLFLSVNSTQLAGSQSWTLWCALWSVVGSLSGMRRCACCISPGKVVSQNTQLGFLYSWVWPRLIYDLVLMKKAKERRCSILTAPYTSIHWCDQFIGAKFCIFQGSLVFQLHLVR